MGHGLSNAESYVSLGENAINPVFHEGQALKNSEHVLTIIIMFETLEMYFFMKKSFGGKIFSEISDGGWVLAHSPRSLFMEKLILMILIQGRKGAP